MSSSAVVPQPGNAPVVAPLPKNTKSTTFGLLILATLLPPLAVYLDGATTFTVGLNIFLTIFFWFLAFLPGIIHAYIYILRSGERRKISRPARYRLYALHAQGTQTPSGPKSQETAPQAQEPPKPTAGEPAGPNDPPIVAPVTRIAAQEDPFADPPEPERRPTRTSTLNRAPTIPATIQEDSPENRPSDPSGSERTPQDTTVSRKPTVATAPQAPVEAPPEPERRPSKTAVGRKPTIANAPEDPPEQPAQPERKLSKKPTIANAPEDPPEQPVEPERKLSKKPTAAAPPPPADNPAADPPIRRPTRQPTV